jgi:mRNA interferase MazF
VRRGDIVIVSLPGDFGKPRPAAIIQSDSLIGLDTVVVCPLTSTLTDELTLRPTIEPNQSNGLRAKSQAMVDKLMTVRVRRVTEPIGRLSDEDLAELDQRLAFVLGFREN